MYEIFQHEPINSQFGLKWSRHIKTLFWESQCNYWYSDSILKCLIIPSKHSRLCIESLRQHRFSIKSALNALCVKFNIQIVHFVQTNDLIFPMYVNYNYQFIRYYIQMWLATSLQERKFEYTNTKAMLQTTVK